MSPQCPRAQLFMSFLRSLSGGDNTTHLFLLGDVFDLWVADHRYFIDRYREIVDEIRRLSNEGVEVSYFEGNHDLHLDYYWADKLGLTVHSGPTYVQLGEQTVRIEHGDEMDPDDKRYRFLRWFLRTPLIRLLLRHLPGRLIAYIGNRASATSRQYSSTANSIDADKAIAMIRAHASKAHEARPFDLIISGHVHVRDDYKSAGFRSVNLGSWLDAPCYFKIDAGGERFCELNETPALASSPTLSAATH